MFSMSMKFVWIILQEQRWLGPLRGAGDISECPRRGRVGGQLPVVGAEPVERHVQLDDVGAKQHEVPDLRRAEGRTGSPCGLSP